MGLSQFLSVTDNFASDFALVPGVPCAFEIQLAASRTLLDGALLPQSFDSLSVVERAGLVHSHFRLKSVLDQHYRAWTLQSVAESSLLSE